MRILRVCLSALVIVGLFSSLGFAAVDRIAGAIDSSQRVELAKSLHPKARREFDRGAVAPSFKLTYMTLVTAPSPSQQKALDLLLAQQQDPTSENYRRWLTPAQFADQFGLTQNDLNKVTTWLTSQGFKILSIGGGRNSVSFSGNAAQVTAAFGTEIHKYKVNEEEYFANSTPVMLPSALNGIVTTVMGLHSFLPKPAIRGRGANRNARPDYYDAAYVFPNFLAPGDIATIYDLTKLYTKSPTPIDGTGQTLAIIGETDVYLADVNDFRNGFSLDPITGCTTNAAGIVTACNSTYFRYVLVGADPGTTYACGDLGEADLDLEWSGAVARKAQIIFVNAPLTYDVNCNVTGGGGVNSALNAAINPPSGPPVAHVVSMSYGICEAEAQDLETLLQQGNAEGVTILNSSGDQGAAACDNSPQTVDPPYSPAIGGLAVNYPASSPEVTGVGGTAITLANDSYPAPSSYWGTSLGANGGTAASYIPETAWNDVEELALYCHSPASGDTFCSQGGAHAVPGWVPLTSTATAAEVQEDIWISSGGGGASNCSGQNQTTGVCTNGFAQPIWQQALSVPGAPAGVRYVPDVSMLASPDFPGYIYCTPPNAPTTTTSSCSVSILDAVQNGSRVGGTSASTPIFAGIVALLNQLVNGTSSKGLGNINSTLYTLAKTPANKAFNKVNAGDNMAYCQVGTPSIQPAAQQCPSSGANAGILGYSASNKDATTGYNLVTGLGSVDADNLALVWPGVLPATTTTLVANPASINQGQSVALTATVAPSTATGTVNFYVSGTTLLGTATLTSGIATLQTTTLPAGSDSVTAVYGGDSSNQGSTSNAVTVTVAGSDFSITTNPTATSVVAGNTTGTIGITVSSIHGFASSVSLSCPSLPAGVTACNFNLTTVNPTAANPAAATVTITTAASMAAGTVNVMVTGTNGNLTHSAIVALTVTATNQTITLTPQATTYPVVQGGTITATLTLTSSNGFNTPLTYTCSDPASESTCTGPIGPNTLTSVPFVIKTTPPTARLERPLDRGMKIFYAAMLPGLLGIMFTAGSRKRSLRGMRLLSLIVALGFSTLWLGSCGGSNGSTKNPGTPAGNYSVVVNATTSGANPVTGTATINLVVTQ